MHHHKRGFTLTELLIVVIVIGILSAVVLPRYNKTLETRKTTEAEDILSAIRTEQERRCTLGKKYVTDMAKLTEIVPNATTDNFLYSLAENGGGTLASSLGSYSYTLQMPSYADGRICCEGEECSKLNKDYPTCEELTQSTDFKEAAECLSSNPVNPIDPFPVNPVNPVIVKCLGPSSQPCGCNNQGSQTRTCGEDGWNAWGECSVGSACCGTAGTVETKSCNTSWTLPKGSCYGQTRVCQDNGTWSDWSGCQNYACAEAETLALGEITCKQSTETTPCGCGGTGHKTRTCGAHGWSEWSACDKPETNCCSLNPADWGTQNLDFPFDPATRTTCHIDGHPADQMCGTKTRECLASTLTYSDWGPCQHDASTMCGGGTGSVGSGSNPDPGTGSSGGSGGGTNGSGGSNGNMCTGEARAMCCCRNVTAALPKPPMEVFSFYYTSSIGGGGGAQVVVIDNGDNMTDTARICGGAYTNPVGAFGWCNSGVWMSTCSQHPCR